MDGIAIKCGFCQQAYCRLPRPWHFKSNEGIITKFNWHGLQIMRIDKKKKELVGVAIYKTVHQKVIFKIFDQKGFRQVYGRPSPFTAIPSICNQRSLLYLNNNASPIAPGWTLARYLSSLGFWNIEFEKSSLMNWNFCLVWTRFLLPV